MAASSTDFGSRRICYINCASHLLNAYNPNVLYPDLPHRWSDEDWFRFIDMIADFGFNVFEFWLLPSLFCREALDSPVGREFTRQMNAVIDHAASKGCQVDMLAGLATVGPQWHTNCPNIPEEWDEVLGLWDAWTSRLKGLAIVSIFPGDPGACSINGCTAETYIDKSIEVAHLVRRNLPDAEIEFGTWGPPFFGWGIIEGPPGWHGEFVQNYQTNAWRFDKERMESSMAHLMKRLGDFPPNTSVAINMGFNGDGNPGDEADARAYAREIARTRPIQSWDFSVTEGENAIIPHYRFERLFERRRLERAEVPYRGGICFTMTPLLNQLSLYEAAQSFINPDGDHRVIAADFFEKVFGPKGRALAAYMSLFEVVPDWGHYGGVDLSREELHRKMNELASLLEALRGEVRADAVFHPSPETYRQELLFYARLFADLSGPGPDFDALRQRFWDRVYRIYDHLGDHVDPRPRNATENLIRHFSDQAREARPSDPPIAGKWV